MACSHIRNYDINTKSKDPNVYYWKCTKCGRFGEDITHKNIMIYQMNQIGSELDKMRNGV